MYHKKKSIKSVQTDQDDGGKSGDDFVDFWFTCLAR